MVSAEASLAATWSWSVRSTKQQQAAGPSSTRSSQQRNMASSLTPLAATMNDPIPAKEISVSGRFLKIARLRHEWCDFVDDPETFIRQLRGGSTKASVFTFVSEIDDRHLALPYQKEMNSVAVLPVSTFDEWWRDLGNKKRNQIRKAEKSGIQLRIVQLDAAFADGVESIYSETKIRQGRRFYHYGKKSPELKEELGSVLDRCLLVGAYYQQELVGFMKLYEGRNVLRAINIIAKVKHRDKCVMDALIAKGVELCGQRGIHQLHYGSWTDGGVGAFREKHGFQRLEVPRYFVPLTFMGRVMLMLNLHRPARQRLPRSWTRQLMMIRTKWNSWRFGESH